MSVLLKRIVKILEMTLLLICGACFLSCLITGIGTGKPSIFGFRPFFVMTGSMEPTIRIPFMVIHRVREIRGDIFIFQGDNETEPDPPVRAEHIGYRVVWIAQGL